MTFRSCVYTFVVGIALATSLQAQEQAKTAQEGASQQQHSSNNLSLGFPIRIIEDDESAEARKSREAEADQREKDDLKAQQGMNLATKSMNDATQSMVYAAWVSAFFVGIGTVLLVWTLLLTRQANKAARAAVDVTLDIGKAQVRAYVGVEIVNVLTTPDERGCFHGAVVFKNTGQSPAREIRTKLQILLSMDIRRVTVQHTDFEGSLPLITETGGDTDIQSGQAAEIRVISSATDAKLDAVKLLNEGYAVLFARGFVKYTDVFGDRHETHFCWHRDSDAVRKGFNLIRSDFGNSSD